jgi:hypothetical protein
MKEIIIPNKIENIEKKINLIIGFNFIITIINNNPMIKEYNAYFSNIFNIIVVFSIK